MPKKLVIVGAGEFAQIAYEYFTHDSDYEVAAFSIDKGFITQESLFNMPVVDLDTLTDRFPPTSHSVFVAATHTKLNRVRKQLFERVKALGYKCATYTSSRAFVWHNVRLGENVFIFENNVLQPFTEIKDNVILWSGNHLGHRSIVECDAYLSSHVVVSGYCRIGARSFLGVNSTVVDNIEIAEDNFIAAGAVVTKSTQPGLFYRGNPAQPAKVSCFEYFKIEVPSHNNKLMLNSESIN